VRQLGSHAATRCSERNAIDGTSSEVKNPLVWHPFEKTTSVRGGLAAEKATTPEWNGSEFPDATRTGLPLNLLACVTTSQAAKSASDANAPALAALAWL